MKVGFISLGCPKNLVDSEVMLGLVREAGHELTNDASRAEVLVVNTCAFIDSAKQESVDAILDMARHKKDGACQQLIVTGCLAERYRDDLMAEMPEIDAVLGTGEVPQIVSAIARTAPTQPASAPLTFFRPGAPVGEVSPPVLQHTGAAAPASALAASRPSTAAPTRPSTQAPPHLRTHAPTHPRTPVPSHLRTPLPVTREVPTYIYDVDTPRVLVTPGHYAYVKIAEGCDYKCAFCIIPTLRGSYRSRAADSILREARELGERGVKELLLISQDTTFYGNDRGERGALARLLRELNTVPGIEWIRLLYLYPTTIDDRMLAAMAECEKVCNYIDLPLQHASDRVLKRMKRPGTRKRYDALLTRIRDRVPGVALRTTFIVGFPGETEEDVQDLLQFVSDHPFEHVGVFTYSHEEGTSAHVLSDDVQDRSKRARRNRVMALQKRLLAGRHRARIGSRARVMVDGPSADHELILRARLATQAPDIDASVYLTECDPSAHQPGDFLEVEILGAKDYDFIARPNAML